MKRLLLCLALATTANLTLAQTAAVDTPAATSAAIIGYVKTVQGDARIETDGQAVSAAVNGPVTAQSVLKTGANGSMGVTFQDNTLLAIGPNTELRMENYAYEPVNAQLGFAAKLLRGSMNYVSGIIAKLNPQSVRITTPSGLIGVRGTQFVARTGNSCPFFAWLFNDRSYADLLADADGHVGAIVIQGKGGEHILSTQNASSDLDGSATERVLSQEEIQNNFGATLAARPRYPQHFILYFETGGAALTAESQAQLPGLLSQAQAMNDVDVTVIGHTDTVGDAKTNARLAQDRAQTIADLLTQQGLKPARMTVDSHGESELLIATPDDTPEPRNRRVEVTLR